MSAKGTTWRKAEKMALVERSGEDKLPEWVYKLIDTLSAEIQLLKDEIKKLKNDNSN